MRVSHVLLAVVFLACGDNQTADKRLEDLRRKARNGDVEVQVKLGNMYWNGKGVDRRDRRKAVRWFRKAAEQGEAIAQNNLSRMYQFGNGVDRNLREAVRWFRKAAEGGNVSAQYDLGLAYWKGEGALRDYVVAYAWLSVAAANGHDSAGYWRDDTEGKLKSKQLAKAQELARQIWEDQQKGED